MFKISLFQLKVEVTNDGNKIKMFDVLVKISQKRTSNKYFVLLWS